jgi:hypothetical protein
VGAAASTGPEHGASTGPEHGASTAGSLDRYLGAGRVVRIEGDRVAVVLEDGTRVQAGLALTFPYRPAIADALLVIGDARAFWAIGVLEARGRAGLSKAEGVCIEAHEGRVRVVGDRGVSVTGPEIRMQAEELRRVARLAVQAFGKLETKVREARRVEANDVDEASRTRWLVQAKRVVIKALRGARLKGPAVRVG